MDTDDMDLEDTDKQSLSDAEKLPWTCRYCINHNDILNRPCFKTCPCFPSRRTITHSRKAKQLSQPIIVDQFAKKLDFYAKDFQPYVAKGREFILQERERFQHFSLPFPEVPYQEDKRF